LADAGSLLKISGGVRILPGYKALATTTGQLSRVTVAGKNYCRLAIRFITNFPSLSFFDTFQLKAVMTVVPDHLSTIFNEILIYGFRFLRSVSPLFQCLRLF
jgi:hypothetical protein